MKNNMPLKQMTPAEKERAMLVDRKEYPGEMPCMVCGFRWMQHKGTLCPSRPGYGFPLDCGDHIEIIPVPPIWGNTTFIPDLAYYSQNPDFDVV
jgi:hypothetical protein